MRLLLREFIITDETLDQEYDLKELKAQAERNFDLGLETFEILTVLLRYKTQEAPSS